MDSRVGAASRRRQQITEVAVFYTKVHNRLLRPLLAADQAQAPPELRAALQVLDRHVDAYAAHARLSRAA